MEKADFQMNTNGITHVGGSVGSNVIEYSGIQIELAKLPEASVMALLRRGVTHYLGNEQASKISSKIEAELNLDDSTDAASRKAFIKDFRVANADLVAKWTSEAIEAALAALRDGTVGQGHARGPRADTVEGTMTTLAKAEVLAVLRANNIKIPKKDQSIAFANGTTRTMDEMIAKRLKDHGDRLRKEADKKLAEDAKKAKKAREQADAAKASGSVDPDALGL